MFLKMSQPEKVEIIRKKRIYEFVILDKEVLKCSIQGIYSLGFNETFKLNCIAIFDSFEKAQNLFNAFKEKKLTLSQKKEFNKLKKTKILSEKEFIYIFEWEKYFDAKMLILKG